MPSLGKWIFASALKDCVVVDSVLFGVALNRGGGGGKVCNTIAGM